MFEIGKCLWFKCVWAVNIQRICSNVVFENVNFIGYQEKYI